MKKLSPKYKVPLTMLIMMPTMMLGMPAIMIYRNLPDGASFIDPWLTAVAQIVPSALLMIVVVGGLANLLVTKILIETTDVSSS